MSEKKFDQENACAEGAMFVKSWKRHLRGKRVIRSVVWMALLGIIFGIFCYGYYKLYCKVPEHIYFYKDNDPKLVLGVPMTGEVVEVGVQPTQSQTSQVVDLGQEAVLHLPENTKYLMRVKLFGIFPVKEMELEPVAKENLLPVGYPVGIYVDAKGLLVAAVDTFADENGEKCYPCEGKIQVGDVLLDVNGTILHHKEDLVHMVEESEGRTLTIRLEREGKTQMVQVRARKSEAGIYKLGIWVRDDTQGVGTMTYMKQDGNFAALGHGINDVDSGRLMELEDGSIYETQIVRMTKGKPGIPGQMTGMIVYREEGILGSLEKNTTKGIYGVCNEKGRAYVEEHTKESPMYAKSLPIALKQDVELGKAQILTTVDEDPVLYEVNITALHLSEWNSYREIEFEVVDSELIAATGGIIQGMSGSPIIQNGHLIGAVTHVLVNDPTKGYGIFIENMLQ